MTLHRHWPTRLAYVVFAAGAALALPVHAAAPSAKDRAIAASVMAKGELEAGNFTKAAALYHEAYKMDPSEPGYLFSAARAEDKGNDLPPAERDYAAFLKLAPPKHEKYPSAQTYLLEVRSRVAQALQQQVQAMKAKEEAAKAAPTAAPTAVPAPSKPAVLPGPASAPALVAEVHPANWPAWSALAGGVALLGSGLGLYLAQGEARQELDTALTSTDAQGRFTGIAYDDYAARRGTLNARYTTAAALAGVGAVATGVGAWLLVRSPGKVAVVPSAGGVIFARRF